MKEKRTIVILSLITFVFMVAAAVILARNQTENPWPLEERISFFVVAFPFLTGSILGGLLGVRVHVLGMTLAYIIEGYLLLYILSFFPSSLLSDTSSNVRLSIMAISWSLLGTIAGYRAQKFISRLGIRAYFFVIGVTFTAVSLIAIIVEGPLTRLLSCFQTGWALESSSALTGCRVFDLQSDLNVYYVCLLTGIYAIFRAGGEMTLVGFRTVRNRFFRIIGVLGPLEFLVEFFAQDFVSSLVWLFPETPSPAIYRAIFAVTVAALLALPLKGQSPLLESGQQVHVRNRERAPRNNTWSRIRRYILTDPKSIEINGTTAFSITSYLLIAITAFLYVHFSVGFKVLFSLPLESFRSSGGFEYIAATVILIYGIGASISVFFAAGLDSDAQSPEDRQSIVGSMQTSMWNAHENFITRFVGSDYDLRTNEIRTKIFTQGISLIRSLVRMTAAYFAPLFNINVFVLGAIMFSIMILSLYGRSAPPAVLAASISFCWFIGGYLSMASLPQISSSRTVRKPPVAKISSSRTARRPTLEFVGQMQGVGWEALGPVGVADHYAYVPAGRDGVRVINIANPAKYREVASLKMPTSTEAIKIVVVGMHAYSANTHSLSVYDLSYPQRPAMVGVWNEREVWNIEVADHLAYVISRGALHIVDFSDPKSPHMLGSHSVGGLTCHEVAIAGRFAYIPAHRTLSIFNISNPRKLETLAKFELRLQGFDEICPIAVLGNHAYLGASTSGLITVDVSDPHHPRQVGEFAQPYPSSVVLMGNYAFIALGHRLIVLDVSNPSQPREISSYTPVRGVMGITIAGEYLYIADRTQGLIVLHIKGISGFA